MRSAKNILALAVLLYALPAAGQRLPNQFPQKSNAEGTDELYTQASGTAYRIVLDSVRMFMAPDIDLVALGYEIDSTGLNVVDSLRGRFVIDASGDWWYVDKDKSAVAVSGGGGAGTDDQTAAEVPITDAGAHYAGTDVEAALQEVGDSLATHRTAIDTKVDGSGTMNALAKFTPDGNTIGNADITAGATSIDLGAGTDTTDLNSTQNIIRNVVTVPGYPNSRDDSGSTTPLRPLYTSGTGSLRVAPIGSYDLEANPFGGNTTLQGNLDSLYANSGGSGTVTSVGLTLPSQFTVTGSPVTTSGTLAGAWQNQAANTVLAGPTTGGAAAPTFRSLVAADITAGGGALGSGTTNRTAVWTASNTLGNSYLLQSATALTLDAGKAFRVTGGTTASIPSAVAGLHYYDQTVSRPKWSDGVSWYDYSPWARITNGISFTDATRVLTINDNTFLYNTTGSTTNTHLGSNANYGHTSTSSTFVGSSAGSGNNSTRTTALGASAGSGSTGSWQTFLGVNAGLSSAQSESVYIGVNAGINNTGAKPVIVGVTAGSGNTGANPTMVGFEAGQSNTGSSPTLMGYRTGKNNTGHFLTALGYSAGGSNTGANATLVGYGSGASNTGDNLTSIGYVSGQFNKGDDVTFIGYQSGYINTGSFVSGFGQESLYGNSTDSLTAIGYRAGAFQADVTKRDTFYMVDKSGNTVKIWGSTSKWGGVGDVVVLESNKGASNFSPNRIAQWTINTDSTLTCLEITSGTLDSNFVTLTIGLNFSNTTMIGAFTQATQSNQIVIGNDAVENVRLGSASMYVDAGNLGLAVASPTSRLHLPSGTATASTAPLKFTSGTNLTTPEAGAVEFDGTNYFATASTTRYTLAKTLTATAVLDFSSTSAQTSSDLTITVTGAADGDAVYIGVPNGSVAANTCFTGWVSATNTVTIRFNNYSSGAIDPASGTFRAVVTKY